MSEQAIPQVTISVDLKKFRIRIHKNTLELLGFPKHVQILVSPASMMLAIQGVENSSRDSHKVNLSILQSDTSYEIYSEVFICKLCSMVPDLNIGCTYRITGKILSEENTALFPLGTFQKIESLGG